MGYWLPLTKGTNFICQLKVDFCTNMYLLQRLKPVYKCFTSYQKFQTPLKTIKRNMDAVPKYREKNYDVPVIVERSADVIMTIFWYWVLWHTYYQFEHFLGHEIPDPRKWTDKELGIPDLDAD